MPIIGMTDEASLRPRLPRLGRLRKGGPKKKNKKGEMVYGDDLSYFRFTSDRPEVVADFYEIYGKEPRVINVYLYYATLHENFPTWVELWRGNNVLEWRSDGENQILWLENGEYQHGSRPHVTHKDESYVGRLEVIIPELLAAGHKGTIMMETGSINDILAISGVLKAAELDQARKGNDLGLRGIPFILRRVQETVSAPGWGDNKNGRARVKKFLVKLEPPPNVVMIDATLEGAVEVKTIESPQVNAKTSEVIEGEVLDDAPEPDDGLTDTAAFVSAAAAIAWAFDQGVFRAKTHAKNAYAKCKKAGSPNDAAAMAVLWHADVAHRVAVKKAREYPTGPGTHLGDCDLEKLQEHLVWCDEHGSDVRAAELGGYVNVLIDEMTKE